MIYRVKFNYKIKGDNMIKVNIPELLKKNSKTKYWLCQQMNITSRNLNRIIRGETASISFKYIEEFCTLLECYPNDLFTITNKIEEKNEKIKIPE